MAMKSPAIIATFMYVQKASVGVVNTSFMSIFVSGRWMNFMMVRGEVQGDAEADGRWDEAPDDAGAELRQVIEERHLAVVDVAHHHSVTKCRSCPTPRPAAKPSRIARVT